MGSSERATALVDGRLGPAVAVSVDRTPSVEQMNALCSAGADVVEYRLDRFDIPVISGTMPREANGNPVSLLTIRHAAEGGSWNGDEAARLALFRDLAEGFDMVDVELESDIAPDVLSLAREVGSRVVVSWHRFDRSFVPAEATAALERAGDLGADIFKLACPVDAIEDFSVLTRWMTEDKPLPVAFVMMSSMGPASRVLFPLLGSRLTYASGGGAEPVPGQMSLEETVAVLRMVCPEYDARKSAELESTDNA